MRFDDSFYSAGHNAHAPSRFAGAGGGLVRIVMLFGSAAIALALILVPILNNQAAKIAAESILPVGIDRTTTASLKKSGTTPPVVKRAHTQPNAFPAPVSDPLCITKVDGRQGADC